MQFDDLFKIAWEEDAANKALQEGGVQQSAEDTDKWVTTALVSNPTILTVWAGDS